MRYVLNIRWVAALLVAGFIGCISAPALADTIKGQVLGGGQPIVNSTVTIWVATFSEPTQMGQSRTDADGQFTINFATTPQREASLYLIANGGHSAGKTSSADNNAIALMTVLGRQSGDYVTINEMTTIASVWTHAQFLDGKVIKGHALGLRIAAGNVPNFVNLKTGS